MFIGNGGRYDGLQGFALLILELQLDFYFLALAVQGFVGADAQSGAFTGIVYKHQAFTKGLTRVAEQGELCDAFGNRIGWDGQAQFVQAFRIAEGENGLAAQVPEYDGVF